MSKSQEVANLIKIRDYLNSLVNNLMVKMDREQLKNVQLRINALDKIIIDESLSMDLTNLSADSKITEEDLKKWRDLFVGTDTVVVARSKSKKKEIDS
jgi:hypothetical protein